MKKQVLILFMSLTVSGCTRLHQADNDQVSTTIANRIDKHVNWNESCFEDPCITAFIQALLSQTLTSESVTQIALLKNPQVQATFEELGIAQADLVEAGLISNPAFEVEVRYPHVKKLRTNIEYLVTATFLDIFLVPLRKRLATAQLEQAKRKVAHEILNLAFEVRQTYYELLGEQQKLKYTRSIVELTSIHGEIVSRQNKVGNVNHLDFQQMLAKFFEAKLEIAKEQTQIIRLREKLNRLLGLSEDTCLLFPEEVLEEVDYNGFDLCALESIALEERLDLEEARFEVIRLRRMLGLKDWWTFTNLKAGVSGERDSDGLSSVGYGVSGEIPIFNFGQAARMRIFAQLRQAQDRYLALEIRILSEVREAHKLVMADLEIINDYRERIIPLQSKILSSSEELYNVMGIGVTRLLENKRQEFEAYRNLQEILKDYWVARVQLDKALGGYLFRLLFQEGCITGAIE
ncbi:MAG: TolC family protein [Parachlamydiaceae bacterium]|nr:TolC family protein [Parachlamydiaceae bacterium]